MSENASTNELTSQYTAQVTADLERNTKEQERLSAEITALQEQLAALERDHGVLVSIQQAIDSAPAPLRTAEPVGAVEPAGSVTVPAPRKKSAVASGARKRVQPKKAAAQPSRSAEKPGARKRAAAKKGTAKNDGTKKDTAQKETAQKEAPKTAQPTLVELVRGHLAQQSEPRSAAEIATSLGETHPERSVKITVIRTTLEGLVAKAQAQRTKQGSSVFYTAADASEAKAPAQAEKEPATADA
ncbi:hypothetical protein [Streptomyces rishiriensis]|uniref:hypothetical protein n=1 Tax=Streptomyces rishiriensis TaxID=68264 RepID=UPI000D5948B4|nr:hypothetical protein [Streptomyces rishiriensis]